MARRNLWRTLLSASLLVGSVAAGVLAAPNPAGAVGADFHPDHVVIVHETYYESAWGGNPGETTNVYANPGQTIEFVLAQGVGPHHSVRLDLPDCDRRPAGQCERAFDDPNASPEHPVVFAFSGTGTVPFFDGYALAEHNFRMTGQFVVKEGDLPAPTATTTTTTAPPTTTTTRPVTTTTTVAGPTTTTTAPTAIRPLVISDPAPTTTTTGAPHPAPSYNAPAAPAPNKDKGKKDDKAKVKAAGTETPDTASPAPGLPNDVVFDAATLTPGPTTLTDGSGGDVTVDTDEVALDAAPVVGLLDHVEQSGDDTHLMFVALGGLTLLLLAGGIWGWHNRPSRYDPA